MDSMGVFGHGGEYRPRYGLWLDTSPECQAAVSGLLSEGFDCDVVLKFGGRCEFHGRQDLSFRPVLSLSEYRRCWTAGEVDQLLDAYPGNPADCTPGVNSSIGGCYVREVYFPSNVALRRREVV